MTRVVYIKGNWAKVYGKKGLLGKLKILDTDQPGAYVSHFAIKEAHRSCGHGAFLLSSVCEYVMQKGCSAISLHCAMSNVRALEFYKRQGFFIAATTTTARYSTETGIVERNYLLVKKLS